MRRGELFNHLSLDQQEPQAGANENPFEEPASPLPTGQATHPALQAARTAATMNLQSGRPQPQPPPVQTQFPQEPAMPQPASAAHGAMSPSGYARQFQPTTSFSDPPQRQQRHSKRPSLFRRSVVALTGGGSHPPASGAGLQRKPSALRKSMAWLLGPPPAVRLAPGMGDQPNVPGEKGAYGSQGPFLGSGGEGSEWDVNGSGAAFWKRFSVAQRHAQNQADPITQRSKEFVHEQKSANRKMRWGVIFALIVVVALVIGLAVGIPAAHKNASGPAASSSEASSKQAKRGLPPLATVDVSASGTASPWGVAPTTMPTLQPRSPPNGRTHQKFAHRQAVARAASDARQGQEA